jgi:hypothetical protein
MSALEETDRATTHAHIRSVVRMTDREFDAYCRRIDAGLAKERAAIAEDRRELAQVREWLA